MLFSMRSLNENRQALYTDKEHLAFKTAGQQYNFIAGNTAIQTIMFHCQPPVVY
jgi:hypothetical protein